MPKWNSTSASLPSTCRRASPCSCGARRNTGKSTLLRQRFPRATASTCSTPASCLSSRAHPWRLRERVQALDASARAEPIVIDEVQKVPAVLDEVHGLIESDRLRFVLCGSSLRKLKRGRANLLGGRAWRAALAPARLARDP